jgi:hypothetical protein
MDKARVKRLQELLDLASKTEDTARLSLAAQSENPRVAFHARLTLDLVLELKKEVRDLTIDAETQLMGWSRRMA